MAVGGEYAKWPGIAIGAFSVLSLIACISGAAYGMGQGAYQQKVIDTHVTCEQQPCEKVSEEKPNGETMSEKPIVNTPIEEKTEKTEEGETSTQTPTDDNEGSDQHTNPPSNPNYDSNSTDTKPGNNGENTKIATPGENVVHLVQPGDTLSSISARYGVSVDQLAYYNGIVDVNLIYSGSALRVPYLLIPHVGE